MTRALALALALAAGLTGPALAAGPGAAPSTEAGRAECLALGGTFGPVGLFPGDVCIRPTADGGKACTRAGDCEGPCMADTMTCSEVTPVFGCYDYMNEQGRKSGICVD